MARVLCVLVLFTIIGACACTDMGKPRTMPIPAAGKHAVRRSPSDNWPGVYPDKIITIGGVYANRHSGEFLADGTYNDRPVYRSGGWSIYYRVSGYAANQWVLDFNDVSEDWDGSVAIQTELFASTV